MSVAASSESGISGGFWNRMLSGETVWVSAAWYLAALLGLSWVLIANAVPLYYFDTAGYLEQGSQILDLIGLSKESVVEAGSQGSVAVNADNDTVQGNRSLIFGIWLSLFENFLNLQVAAIAQSIILVIAVLLVVRLSLRAVKADLSVAAATGVSVLAASLGSAPFYTAFLMPDIFAPILILSLAALSAFTGSLKKWEVAAFVLLGAMSVVMHPSHLIMALLFVPAAPFLAMLSGGRRVLLSMCLVGVVALVGVTERFAFTFAAEEIAGSEVVYLPFLTARLIVDGPGLDYLEEVCPEAGLATCDLIEMFVIPYQITASHIIFETSKELGSFKLLPEETQRSIIGEQSFLLREVIRTRAFALIGAVGYNVWSQLLRVSVNMTLPDEGVLEGVRRISEETAGYFEPARLTGWPYWLPRLALFQNAIYLLSTLVVVVAVVWPRLGGAREFRTFAATVLFGILVNAFVCGALSQPADRYGARVIFLLPALAAIIVLLWARRGRPATGEKSADRLAA